MSSGKLLEVNYYLKRNGKVKKLTKEEYEQLKKELKKEGKKYICPNCNVCDCEKIKYTDITRCKEVDYGLYIKKVYEFSADIRVEHTIDEKFEVYDCERFHPFKEAIIHSENVIRNEIIKIDKQILLLKKELEVTNDKEKIQQVIKLQKIKSKKLKQITTQEVLKRLFYEESLLLEDFEKEQAKKLRLENNGK